MQHCRCCVPSNFSYDGDGEHSVPKNGEIIFNEVDLSFVTQLWMECRHFCGREKKILIEIFRY